MSCTPGEVGGTLGVWGGPEGTSNLQSLPINPHLPSESGEDCVVILDDDEDVQEIPDDGDGK